MKKDLYLTTHSKERFEQRTDYDYNKQVSNATQAFKKGYEFSRFRDPLFGYLKSLSYDSNGRYVPKIFDDFVYIFENRSGHRLITVYPVPGEYHPCSQYAINTDDLKTTYIALCEKQGNKVFYWGEDGLVTSLDDAIEFKSQIKANNYLNNNGCLNELTVDYTIELI